MLTLILLLLSVNLFATTYSSNKIGQLLDIKSELTGFGYEVEVENNSKKLFLNGVLIEETTVSDNIKTIKSSDKIEQYKTENGKCVYHLVQTENSKIETYYEWDDDCLFRKRIVSDGKLEKIITYFIDEGTLLGYQETMLDSKKLTLINNRTLGYTTTDPSCGEIINHFDNLMFKTEFESENVKPALVEEGENTIIFTDSDGSKTKYDKNGLIIEKEIKENDVLIKTEYFYDSSDVLNEKITIEGEKKIISSYKDGVLDNIATYIGNELFSIRYFKDEITETRYKNGKPFAILSYDEDGKSLLEVKIL